MALVDQIAFGTNDFAENPEPRVPCVLVLDVSGSMAGMPIWQLNQGIQALKEEISADSMTSKRAEIAIITFGEEVTVQCDFTTAEGFNPPTLVASGMTPMGEAVARAMELLEQRKQQYRANGISCYRPWIFLITDGEPNDSGWEAVAARAKAADEQKSFALFAVGVDEARFDVLRMFSPREPLRLNGLRFKDLFLWLSSSLKSVSRSSPGEEVPLQNPVAPGGWASIA
jgi:uncharacterized protein YegL